MKRIFTLAAVFVASAAGLASAAIFNGNGATGFGGTIGGSTLSVTESTPGTISFSLSTAGNFNSNALVLYVDSKAGGDGSTLNYTDTADGGRTAISGFNSGNPSRTLAVFPVGFGADYALTVEPGVYGGLFDLSTPSNFNSLASGGLTGSGSGPFTFSYTRAQLGLPVSGGSFSFVGSLISTSAYRSNETIGTSVTVPDTSSAPNGGFNGVTTFAFANTVVVPEPTTLGLIGGIVVTALRRRR